MSKDTVQRLALSVMIFILTALVCVLALFAAAAIDLFLNYFQFWKRNYVLDIAVYVAITHDAWITITQNWLDTHVARQASRVDATGIIYGTTIPGAIASIYALLTLWERNVKVARVVLGLIFFAAFMTPSIVVYQVDPRTGNIALYSFVFLMLNAGVGFIGMMFIADLGFSKEPKVSRYAQPE